MENHSANPNGYEGARKMSNPNFTSGPWIFNAHDGSITDSSAANNDIAEVYDG